MPPAHDLRAFKVTPALGEFPRGRRFTEANSASNSPAPPTRKCFFKVSGFNTENLAPVVIDLEKEMGKEIFIRVVDQQIGGWGHINFDHRLLRGAAQIPNASAAKIAKQGEAPPVDDVEIRRNSHRAGREENDAAKRIQSHALRWRAGHRSAHRFLHRTTRTPLVRRGMTYPKRIPKAKARIAFSFSRIPTRREVQQTHGLLDKLNLVSGIEVWFRRSLDRRRAVFLMFVPVSDWNERSPRVNRESP